MLQFENVCVLKKANIYFDGKCVSHTIVLADGSKKSLGVIFPSSLTFSTAAPEVMELNAGKCRVRVRDSNGQPGDWQSYGSGQSFSVPGNSSFDIETQEMLDYVCHFVPS